MVDDVQLGRLRRVEESLMILQRRAMELVLEIDTLHETVIEMLSRELAGPLVP